MIVMLDGTHTVLGPQVTSVLFGYILGVMAAISSFLFGKQVSNWLNRWRNPDFVHDDTEEANNTNIKADEIMAPPIIVYPHFGMGNRQCLAIFSGQQLPFIILGVLLVLFGLADFAMGIPFYRIMWLSCLFSPLGALLRWKLAIWNGQRLGETWEWFPWGTFSANVLGSIISIMLLGIDQRFFADSNSQWTRAIIAAIRVGFAGSLSTVSTFVKELVDLNGQYPHHAKAYYYGLITIFSCATLSLAIYSPIVRS